MRVRHAVASTTLLALACAVPPAVGAPRDPSVNLTEVGTYETGVFGASAAEIPAFDAVTDRAFVVNAETGTLDVLRLDAAGRLSKVDSVGVVGTPAADGSTIGAGAVVNGVDVAGGVVAVAVEASDKTSPGWVAFVRSDSFAVLGAVRVGAQPDSLAFAGRARSVVVANEAEPADDFSVDPEGSISVVALPASTRQYARLGQDHVRTVRFTAYDQGTPLPEGVRVFGPDAPVPAGQPDAGYVARNLEPEYVTVDDTGRTAYVSVQEANAIAVVDIASASLTDLWALELSDWSAEGAALDPSDRDGGIALGSWPVLGIPMPDGIDTYRHRGRTLVLTANEGDAREWGVYEEPVRLGDDDYQLCPDVFPDAAALKDDAALGRLEVTTVDGLREDGCYEKIHAFGGRSFSIYTADGELVFDSAGLVEQVIADLIEAGELPESAFNANNDETPSFESRSDAKGPEPEAVVVGRVQGRSYAFVGLERIGGIMVFDVTDPRAVSYVDYVTNRDFSVEVDGAAVPGMGDLGPEGLEFVPAGDSPTGVALLVVGNEVSGTTTVYEVAATR